MIIYFSGTGNSKLLAHYLAEKLNDKIIDLGSVIDKPEKWHFSSKSPFVFVCPIYAWQIPRKISHILANATFEGNDAAYFFVTMGGQYAAADKYIYKILSNKLNILGFKGITMPDNFTIVFKAPVEDEAIACIERSINDVDRYIELIKDRKLLPSSDHHFWDNFLSETINNCFYRFMLDSCSFGCNDNCIKCKQCINDCPCKNITLKDNKIAFGNNCMFCLKCINLCPVKAITYKNKPLKKGNYKCPEIEKITS